MKDKLRKELDKVLQKYIAEFEKKHDLEMEYVVSDDLMGVINFGDTYFFSINDIVYDIDEKLERGLIIEWLEYNLENQENYVNLHSYSKGYRHEKKANR